VRSAAIFGQHADEEGGMAKGTLAVMALREEDGWQVSRLPVAAADDLDGLLRALGQQPPALRPVVLVDVDDEFFVALRLDPAGEPRALLSDVTAAADYDLAEDVLDLLGEETPEDLDDVWPAGDLGIFADLGLPEMELGAILDDLDLYADEMLHSVARRLGFDSQFDAAIGLAQR